MIDSNPNTSYEFIAKAHGGKGIDLDKVWTNRPTDSSISRSENPMRATGRKPLTTLPFRCGLSSIPEKSPPASNRSSDLEDRTWSQSTGLSAPHRRMD